MVEQQIHKMSGLADTMSEQWTAQLKVLQDLIEHHVAEEESTGFSCARDEFQTEELEAMSRQFQTRKAQIGTRVA
jgi:hemerythrin-like domain-containing protein